MEDDTDIPRPKRCRKQAPIFSSNVIALKSQIIEVYVSPYLVTQRLRLKLLCAMERNLLLYTQQKSPSVRNSALFLWRFSVDRIRNSAGRISPLFESTGEAR